MWRHVHMATLANVAPCLDGHLNHIGAIFTWPLWGMWGRVWMAIWTNLAPCIQGSPAEWRYRQSNLGTRTRSNMKLSPDSEGLLKPCGIMSKRNLQESTYHFIRIAWTWGNCHYVRMPSEGMYHYFRTSTWRYVLLCPDGHQKECIAMFGWPPEGMYRYVRMATWRKV
jgi:hypothetical protein